jgi:hydroxylaminobenzene mutase
MSESLQALLGWSGVLLFLLGLLTGVAIPAVRAPRIALSAHVTAIESGLALIAIGLLGAHLVLSDGWAAAIAHGLWISLYVLWVGLLLGAIFGTGKTLPIAGAGLRAKPWQEATAFTLIGAGSLGSAAAVAALLWQWSWRSV